MKKIKYLLLQNVLEDGTTITRQKVIPYSEANEEIAKGEAYNGEYEMFDDGQPEPDITTTDDILNALLGVTV